MTAKNKQRLRTSNGKSVSRKGRKGCAKVAKEEQTTASANAGVLRSLRSLEDDGEEQATATATARATAMATEFCCSFLCSGSILVKWG